MYHLFSHFSEIIRKKALMTLLKFYEMDKEGTAQYKDVFIDALSYEQSKVVIGVALNGIALMMQVYSDFYHVVVSGDINSFLASFAKSVRGTYSSYTF